MRFSTTLKSIGGGALWLLNALAAAFEVVFSAPLLGRLLKWAWNVLLTLLGLLGGLLELPLKAVGIYPEKKLRVGVVILRKEDGEPLARPEDIARSLEHAVEVFHEAANVRLLRAPLSFGDGQPTGEAGILIDPDPAPSRALNVGCNQTAFWEDLWTPGSFYQFAATRRYFWTNLRRLLGVGAPVIVFVVQDVKGHGGCSVGPLSDYVTVTGGAHLCIAHEVGHACSLLHHPEDTNLMYARRCGKRSLKPWQVFLLRSSRHVTYF